MNPVTELTLDEIAEKFEEIAEKFGIQEVKSVTIKFQTSTPYTNEQNSRTD
jgi:ribosomal protein L7/L12